MNFPHSLKYAAILSVTAAATTLLIQACGGGANAQAADADAIEGVWLATASQVDCSSKAVLSTFRSSQVFHRGGTFGDTSSHPTTVRGPAWGTWSRSGATYTVRFQFLRYSADGTFLGFSASTLTATLAADGKSFTSERATQVLDTAGNTVGAVCTSDVASRFL
jgi:hypothetical protein